jgi:hypothetical protein
MHFDIPCNIFQYFWPTLQNFLNNIFDMNGKVNLFHPFQHTTTIDYIFKDLFVSF